MWRSQRLGFSRVGVPGGFELPDGEVWVLNRGPLVLNRGPAHIPIRGASAPALLHLKNKQTKNQWMNQLKAPFSYPTGSSPSDWAPKGFLQTVALSEACMIAPNRSDALWSGIGSLWRGVALWVTVFHPGLILVLLLCVKPQTTPLLPLLGLIQMSPSQWDFSLLFLWPSCLSFLSAGTGYPF